MKQPCCSIKGRKSLSPASVSKSFHCRNTMCKSKLEHAHASGDYNESFNPRGGIVKS